MTGEKSIYYGPGARDGFSFRRVLDVAHFYGGTIKNMLTVYGLTSLVLAVLMVCPFNAELQFGFYTVAQSALGIMLICSPLVFGKRGDSQVLDRTVPARPDEKLAFYLLFLYVLVPLTLYLLPAISTAIMMNTSLGHEAARAVVETKLKFGSSLWFAVSQDLMYTSVCLYFVLRSRTNRILKGFLALLACGFVMMIVGVFMGYNVASVVAQPDYPEVNPSDFNTAISESINAASKEIAANEWLTAGPAIGCTIIFIVAVALIYHVLKNRG